MTKQPLPGLGRTNAPATKREQHYAQLALIVHATTKRFTVDDGETSIVLATTLCAHVLETADPELGYEQKRELVHTLLDLAWDPTVKMIEANK